MAGLTRTDATLCTRPASRVEPLDALRGLSVLMMFVLHTADSWLLPELRRGPIWEAIRAIGGQAAPLFLWITGVSVGLRWATSGGPVPERPGSAQRRSDRAELAARGLEIVLIGFGLRLVLWWIDGGALVAPSGWLGGVPLGLGYYGLWLASARRGRRRSLGMFAAASAAVGVGIWHLVTFDPLALRMLLRSDVLQTIGASLLALACLEPLARRRPALALLFALAFALLAPIAGAALPAGAPALLTDYLALPGTAESAGRFPLLPWLAYPWLGTLTGRSLALAAQRTELEQPRALLGHAVVGAGLALACSSTTAWAAAVTEAVPWLTPALRVGYRVGWGLMLLGACPALLYALRGHPALLRPREGLLTLGRASLFAYCVHLEVAFGLLAMPMRKALGYGAWALGLALMTLGLVALSAAFLRMQTRARSRKNLPISSVARGL